MRFGPFDEDPTRSGDPADGRGVPAPYSHAEQTRLGSLLEELATCADSRPTQWASAVTDVDGARLSQPLDRLALMRIADRLTAFAQSRSYAAIMTATGIDVDHDGWLRTSHLVHEVAVARRVGETAADHAIEVAHVLALAPGLSDLLTAGLVSDHHVRIFEHETSHVVGERRREVLAAIARRVLGRAPYQSPAQFRRSVITALLALDSQRQADRFAAARDARTVTGRQTADGMGELYASHEWPIINAMLRRLDASARELRLARGGAPSAKDNPDALRSACRADALAHAVLGPLAEADLSDVAESSSSGGATASRQSATPPAVVVRVDLVIDLDTLRGMAQHPCLLDGSPIPAEVGRHLAAEAAWIRRVVTDPADGHLLDYGTTTYLPGALQQFVGRRDGRCTAPYCERPARRCELDHHIPYPHGPSSTANTGLLCEHQHDLKTVGYVDVCDSASDGSHTWITQWGQQAHHPPQPFLDTGQDGTAALATSMPPDDRLPESRAVTGSDPPPYDPFQF